MDRDIHIPRTLWRALASKAVPRSYFEDLVREHLLGSCASCREEYKAFLQQGRAAGTEVKGPSQSAAAQRHTRKQLQALLDLPAAQRLPRIRTSRTRFRGRPLAESLVERSRRALPFDPADSLHFAELAAAVLEPAGSAEDAGDVKVLALALKANALRCLGRLHESERCFAAARCEAYGFPRGSSSGVVDLAVYATLDWQEGAYCRDIRNFGAAERLLKRASLLFALEARWDEARKVQLTLAGSYFTEGDLDQALVTVADLVAVLEGEGDPALYRLARYDHALYLTEAGLYELARRESEALRQLAVNEPHEAMELRLAWLDGRIALGLGEVAKAGELLASVRTSFRARGETFNAALASLDLAIAWLGAGDLEGVLRISLEAASLFAEEDLHDEALAAILLLREAAARHDLDEAWLRTLRRYMLRAQNNPTTRFRPPA